MPLYMCITFSQIHTVTDLSFTHSQCIITSVASNIQITNHNPYTLTVSTICIDVSILSAAFAKLEHGRQGDDGEENFRSTAP